MTLDQDLRERAQRAGAAAGMAAVPGHAMALLLAEMQALAHLMPGLPAAGALEPEPGRAAEARRRAEEAAAEEMFDNMPV